jgi:hypothetical protein
MSQFINFKKRGVTLPPGCKDLIDLLRPSHKRVKVKETSAVRAFEPWEFHKENFQTAGLAQLERFVRILLQSRGEVFFMQIDGVGLKSPVTLYRYSSSAERATAIAIQAWDVPQEEAIRVFFGNRSIEPLMVSANLGTSSLVYPLPSEPVSLNALLTQLLQEVYALGEDGALEFSYHEFDKTG